MQIFLNCKGYILAIAIVQLQTEGDNFSVIMQNSAKLKLSSNTEGISYFSHAKLCNFFCSAKDIFIVQLQTRRAIVISQ